jgi:DNA-binding GntR family transcriptional regulator
MRYSDELADHSYRYRQRAMLGDYRKRNVGAEHQALMQAACAGDEDRAVALLKAHYQRTADASPRGG